LKGAQAMYLARKIICRQVHYQIRQSYRDGDTLRSRDIFDLGCDPAGYIVYPGGNGYYYDDAVVDALDRYGIDPASEDLDRIFWDFLDPSIRRVIRGFDRGKNNHRNDGDAGLHPKIQLFDKRRLHFLKFGQLDQGHIGRISPKLTRPLNNKSRDEMEQHFLDAERILRPAELKAYVYVIFDLQRHFSESFAKQYPGGLNQARMDECFMKDVCRLHADGPFWAGMPAAERLRGYLTRYVIMYFDCDFQSESPLGDFLRDFMDANRFRQRMVVRKRVDMDEAGTLFGVSPTELRAMSRGALTRRYRKLVLRHHPDKGGDATVFCRLTEAYRALLCRKK
jgi:hypothetical protein